MNASLVCLAAVLSAPPQIDDSTTVYKPSADFAAVVRGQTPGYDEIPNAGPSFQGGAPPRYTIPGGNGYVSPPGGGTIVPFQPAPLMHDPFLGPPGIVSPYPSFFTFGAGGPQPYRFGWTVRQEAAFIPKTSTEGNLGNFGIAEFNTELQYTTPLPSGWIFSFTQEYDLRLWEGPHSKTPAAIGLPGQVHRLGWDFEWATPANYPWSFLLAFNPSLNSDFERHPTSDAWNWDGRGIAFYRASPYWMIVLGAGYWDRVNDRVIPYAGAVWTPDDRWEWRMVFPEPRVSYFLGNPYGVATWIYVSGEYHVEAYEIEVQRVPAAVARDKIELEDWRVVLGIRQDCCRFTSFLEGGWIFGRRVDFLRTPGFDVSTGFIVRGGVQF